MAKQALGRNLDALMDVSAAKAEKPADVVPSQKPAVSSGVRSLMRGHQPSVVTPVVPVSRQKATIPSWYFFAGDVLLGALAVGIAWKSPHPLSWQRELFCGATVLLGACLALAAVLLADDEG